MKYKAVDSFYSSETKQVMGGQEIDPKALGLSAERVKEMVKKGLIVEAGPAEDTAKDDAGEGDGGDSGGDDTVDLNKMTRADLDALAAERGVDITEAKNKGDVIELLEKAERAPKNKAEAGAPQNK